MSTYLTILERAWSANFKMVWYVLLQPLRPELNGQDPFQICGRLCQTRAIELRELPAIWASQAHAHVPAIWASQAHAHVRVTVCPSQK
jgi:hypothetical protein